jgi:hypothetical protein
MTAGTVSAAERRLLDLAGDALIPASVTMPSVSDSDPDGWWLERALEARPDLVEPVRALLSARPGLDSLEAIAVAEAKNPNGVAALVTITAGRYYMSPRVRELLGYPGQGGRDPALPTYGWERAAAQLRRVVERGPIYRLAP